MRLPFVEVGEHGIYNRLVFCGVPAGGKRRGRGRTIVISMCVYVAHEQRNQKRKPAATATTTMPNRGVRMSDRVLESEGQGGPLVCSCPFLVWAGGQKPI